MKSLTCIVFQQIEFLVVWAEGFNYEQEETTNGIQIAWVREDV